MTNSLPQSRIKAHIAVAGGIALIWIALGLFHRHDADADPEIVQLFLSIMAVWFVACGIWTYSRIQTPASFLFLWYSAFSAMHWGGPIGVGTPAMHSMELAFFIIFGSLFTQALFLDLARQIEFVEAKHRPRLWQAPYAPVVAGVALFAVFIFDPEYESMLELFTPFYVVGILLSLIGGVILIGRPIIQKKNRWANSLLALTVIAAWAPHSLVEGGVIPANDFSGLYNLPLALIPLALAWRLTRTPVLEQA